MSFVKYYINFCLLTISNFLFYLKNKKEISSALKEHGCTDVKPFKMYRWHHDLYLFTAYNKLKNKVFVKFSLKKGILKNENRAYKILEKNEFFKNHMIRRDNYIKKESLKFLILNHSDGVVLSEDWLLENPHKSGSLIKIVDELSSMSLIHRDIKLDNFIFEEGEIKIFDFTFMIDKTNSRKIKEIDLSTRQNMIKLLDLGIYYKPEAYMWDDYYSLYVIFKRFFKKNKHKLSDDAKDLFIKYLDECKEKIGTNSYSILK